MTIEEQKALHPLASQEFGPSQSYETARGKFASPIQDKRLAFLLFFACVTVCSSPLLGVSILPSAPVGKTPFAICGLLLFGLFVLVGLPNYRPVSTTEKSMICFVLLGGFSYLFTLQAMGLGDSLKSYFSWVQAIVLFLILSFIASKNLYSTRCLMRAFCFAGVLIPILTFLFPSAVSTQDRSGFEALNLNSQAFVLAIVTLFMVFDLLANESIIFASRKTNYIVFAISSLALLATGSRSAFVAFVITAVLMATFFGIARLNIRALAACLVLASAFVVFTIQSGTTTNRITNTIEEGDYGHRDTIALKSLELIAEKPLFGWGPYASYQLGQRLESDKRRDAHNAHLQVMLKSGIPAYLVWLFGLLALAKSSFRTFHLESSRLVIAILAFGFLTSLTGSLVSNQFFWIVLSILVGLMANQFQPFNRDEYNLDYHAY